MSQIGLAEKRYSHLREVFVDLSKQCLGHEDPSPAKDEIRVCGRLLTYEEKDPFFEVLDYGGNVQMEGTWDDIRDNVMRWPHDITIRHSKNPNPDTRYDVYIDGKKEFTCVSVNDCLLTGVHQALQMAKEDKKKSK